MHKVLQTGVIASFAVTALASGAAACSNFGSSNCTPPDTYDRYGYWAEPPPLQVYVPRYGPAPVPYGYGAYGSTYYGYGPAVGVDARLGERRFRARRW